jgi:hypothetical protein
MTLEEKMAQLQSGVNNARNWTGFPQASSTAGECVRGMGIVRTVFRREMRAFNVGAGNHMLECGIELPRYGNRAEAGDYLLF